MFTFSKSIGVVGSNLTEFMVVIDALFIVVSANFNLPSEIIFENDSKISDFLLNNVIDSL